MGVLLFICSTKTMESKNNDHQVQKNTKTFNNRELLRHAILTILIYVYLFLIYLS